MGLRPASSVCVSNNMPKNYKDAYYRIIVGYQCTTSWGVMGWTETHWGWQQFATSRDCCLTYLNAVDPARVKLLGQGCVRQYIRVSNVHRWRDSYIITDPSWPAQHKMSVSRSDFAWTSLLCRAYHTESIWRLFYLSGLDDSLIDTVTLHATIPADVQQYFQALSAGDFGFVGYARNAAGVPMKNLPLEYYAYRRMPPGRMMIVRPVTRRRGRPFVPWRGQRWTPRRQQQ